MSLLKKIGIGLGALLVIGAVAFALGPQVTIDEARLRPVEAPPADPAALERWIAAAEARFDDLTPGTAKHIVWADPDAPARTPLALVYVHGFGATRQETAPVADEVARALGANLYYTRLRGHGRPGAALGEATAEQWMEDAIEAMAVGERLGERVVLVGCSTGATLAVWLAHRLSADPPGPLTAPPLALVLLAPNLGVPDPRAGLVTLPWGEQILNAIVGETYSWEPANPDQARYWTWRHPSRVLIQVQALVEHVGALPPDAPAIPTLAIWTVHDTVVDPAAIEAWVAADRERREGLPLTDDIHRGNHVLAGAIMAPARTARVTHSIISFLEKLTQSAPAGG